jgi:Putative Ig domain
MTDSGVAGDSVYAVCRELCQCHRSRPWVDFIFKAVAMASLVRTSIVLVFAACIGATLAGCNDNTTAANSSAPTTAPDAATVPTTSTTTPTNPATPADSVTITGSAPTSIVAGNSYQFKPTAKDASGKALTFSATNLPSWAKIDKATGAVSGWPATKDVGKSAQIVISASNGTNSAALKGFVITVTERTGVVAELSWVAAATAANGSVASVAGYRIHYGTSAASLSHIVEISDAATSTYTVTDLSQGTWYFAVTAYNSANVESTLSAVVPVTL